MKAISEKVVWITGASSGIGEALAFALDRHGCRLILSARNTGKLKQVKNSCTNPSRVEILPLDLASPDLMPRHVEKAVALFGKIDILVSNAGISQRSLIVDTEMQVFKQLMDINYLGTVALTNALLPYFLDRKQGHFVTVTSLMGIFGSPYRSGYCAAKHALHGYFDVLRMEHAGDGISVTLVCPGFVNTGIAQNALTGKGSAQGANDSRTAAGMEPGKFAEKLIKAIKAKKYEVYIGGKEVAGVYLKRFFPGLLHKVVLRSRVV